MGRPAMCLMRRKRRVLIPRRSPRRLTSCMNERTVMGDRNQPTTLASPPVLYYGLSFFIPLVVYWRTLCPTIDVGDSTEFVTAAYCWGIPHAPGYPLYTLIAHLFTRIPWGQVAWRANLASAFLSCIAVVLFMRLLHKLTGNLAAAFAGALWMAFAEGFWSQALVAEVFALNGVLAVLILLITLTHVPLERP